jgi:hypothetical protein
VRPLAAVELIQDHPARGIVRRRSSEEYDDDTEQR